MTSPDEIIRIALIGFEISHAKRTTAEDDFEREIAKVDPRGQCLILATIKLLDRQSFEIVTDYRETITGARVIAQRLGALIDITQDGDLAEIMLSARKPRRAAIGACGRDPAADDRRGRSIPEPVAAGLFGSSRSSR